MSAFVEKRPYNLFLWDCFMGYVLIALFMPINNWKLDSDHLQKDKKCSEVKKNREIFEVLLLKERNLYRSLKDGIMVKLLS